MIEITRIFVVQNDYQHFHDSSDQIDSVGEKCRISNCQSYMYICTCAILESLHNTVLIHIHEINEEIYGLPNLQPIYYFQFFSSFARKLFCQFFANSLPTLKNKSVNPISTRRADYAHQILLGPRIFRF